MSEGTRKTKARTGLLAALASVPLACAAPDAAAQTAPPPSYQLPPASPTPDPHVQGPVVAEHPFATPTETAPAPAPVPAPLATPATPAPRPAPAATPATTSPRPAPLATASAPLPASPPAARSEPQPQPQPQPTTAEAPPPLPAPPAAPAQHGNRPGWYAAALASAAAVALGLFMVRRRRKTPVAHDAPGQTAASPSAASPSPPAALVPAATQPPAPLPAASALVLTLEVRRFSATLVNASIDYRLRVTNAGAQRLEDIIISGDMIGAHASLPAQTQFAHAGDPLEPRHRIAALAPGESADLSGTLRLPLAGAMPIRHGGAALFVPLVRLCARAGADGPAFASTHVVGEVPTRPGGGLRPFRLDLGPRIYAEVEQRKLAIPA